MGKYIALPQGRAPSAGRQPGSLAFKQGTGNPEPVASFVDLAQCQQAANCLNNFDELKQALTVYMNRATWLQAQLNAWVQWQSQTQTNYTSPVPQPVTDRTNLEAAIKGALVTHKDDPELGPLLANLSQMAKNGQI